MTKETGRQINTENPNFYMTFINFRAFFVPLAALLSGVALFSACGNSPEPNKALIPRPPPKNRQPERGATDRHDRRRTPRIRNCTTSARWHTMNTAIWPPPSRTWTKPWHWNPTLPPPTTTAAFAGLNWAWPTVPSPTLTKPLHWTLRTTRPIFNRALIYDEKGKQKEALADLSEAIRINPDFGDAYYNRGVYLLNSDPKNACADFKKASELGIQEAALTFEQYCK